MRCDEPGCTNRGDFVLSGIKAPGGGHDHRLCRSHAPADAYRAVVRANLKTGQVMRDATGRIVFEHPPATPAADVDTAVELERIGSALDELLS